MGYTTPLGGLGTLYSGGAFYLSPETGPGGLLLRWADWGFFILWRGGLVDWVDWCGGLGFGGSSNQRSRLRDRYLPLVSIL